MNKQKEKILRFIRSHRICSLSTVTPEGKPEAAVVEFGEMPNLELVFNTICHYRKYKNLLKNRHVALVIGWDKNVTVQYEGVVSEISGKASEKYRKAFWKKNPKAKKWEANPDTRFFKVTPTWVRYADLGKKPWEIFEVIF